MKRFFFRLALITSLALAATVGISIYAYIQLEHWVDTPIPLASPVLITVGHGAKIGGVIDIMESEGLIDSSTKFILFVRIHKLSERFQAGQYQFTGTAAPRQIIQALTHGDVYKAVVAEFTIPEGFTMYQIRDRLAAHGIGTAASLDRLLTDRKFIQELGIDSSSLEGYLYPATYQFFSNIPTEKEALKRMRDEFFKRLPADYIEKTKEKGLNLQQSVAFASLIERETLHDDERPLVSEVIWRRLKDGAPLGIDAALIYGIVGYDGDIKWRDLKNTKNLYNTRIHKGLPPTPIASPSVASLLAVLHPADKSYYYYVRIPGPEGRHQFSRTLQEHNSYVQKWIKGSN